MYYYPYWKVGTAALNVRTVSKIVLVGFKSLTYCLRSVSGPLLMQKWPSFLSQTNGFLCPVRCSVHFSAGIARKTLFIPICRY